MRDYVLFYVNGRRCEVRGAAVFQSLADYCRQTLRLTGTKLVCAEGDCGSCLALLGRPRQGQMEYKPVASCIQYLAQLDGAQVVTVEGLSPPDRLNPIQQALVAGHGAQCGYCTPGFVVALCAAFDNHRQPNRAELQRALVGNLCRCTGYASILDSAAGVEGADLEPLSQCHSNPQLLTELQQAAAESVRIEAGSRTMFKPATLAEAVRYRAAEPGARILAGGTDLGVVWNKGQAPAANLLCLGEVPELRIIGQAGDAWQLGAAVTISAVEQWACQALPHYGAMLERFGSPPIKHAGTLGGNLMNGSPIGDTMPALFVLDALVELIGPRGTRSVNINQFYTGYRRTVLEPDELLYRVVLRPPEPGARFAAYKVSKRRDLDISTFTAAFWMRIEGGLIQQARLAYGGVGPTIVRLPQTEAALAGRPFQEATLRGVGDLAAAEIAPISDVRGSAEYRSQLARNLLIKFGREHGAAAPQNGQGRK